MSLLNDIPLYRNASGAVLGFEERRIEPYKYIAINGASESIPPEVNEFMDLTSYHGEEANRTATGKFTKMEWANRADWYDPEVHWRYNIPVPEARKETLPWYYRLEQPIDIDRLSDGTCALKTHVAIKMVNDISTAKRWVREIVLHVGFDERMPRPDEFNETVLHEIFQSEAAMTLTTVAAKRWMLDNIAFVDWFIRYIPSRTHWISAYSMAEIQALKLDDMPRRGVIVKLERDWKQIDFGSLLQKGVPIYYPWTMDSAQDKRFSRLNPDILRDFQEGRLTPHRGRYQKANEVDYADQRITLLDMYTPFLEKREVYNNVRSYGDPRQTGAKFYMLDFKGWKRRHLEQAVDIWNAAGRYAAHVIDGADGRAVMFAAWQTRERQRGEPETPDDILHPEIELELEEDRCPEPPTREEAHAAFKSLYAPRRGETVDIWAGISIHSTGRLIDRIFGEVVAAEQRAQSDALINRLGNTPDGISPMEVDRVPEPHIDKAKVTDAVYITDHRDRGRGGGSSSARRRSASPIRRDNNRNANSDHRSNSNNSNTSAADHHSRQRMLVQGTVDRPREGRGSPPVLLQRMSASRSLSLLEGRRRLNDQERDRYVDGLRRWAFKLTFEGRVARFPVDVEWNANILEYGVLVLTNTSSEVRMRYWANCFEGNRSIFHILELAVERGVQFAIGVQLQDVYRFRPGIDAVSALERNLAKQPHLPGYAEEKLSYKNGATACRNSYLVLLAGVLRRANSGALVGLGGTASWIARRFGGNEIIAKFAKGPSLLVSWHNIGANDSEDERPLYICWDAMTTAELDLIFGHITSEDDEQERWAFPTDDLLREYSHHWSGEWTEGCEKIFNRLYQELRGPSPKIRTRPEWREYLRWNNRGTGAPQHGYVQDGYFDEGKKKIELAFGSTWHKKALNEVVIPERFEPKN